MPGDSRLGKTITCLLTALGTEQSLTGLSPLPSHSLAGLSALLCHSGSHTCPHDLMAS